MAATRPRYDTDTDEGAEHGTRTEQTIPKQRDPATDNGAAKDTTTRTQPEETPRRQGGQRRLSVSLVGLVGERSHAGAPETVQAQTEAEKEAPGEEAHTEAKQPRPTAPQHIHGVLLVGHRSREFY